MKKLAKVEHLQFDDGLFTRIEYNDGSFEWYNQWVSFEDVRHSTKVTKDTSLEILEKEFKNMESEEQKKQMEKFSVLAKGDRFAPIVSPEPNVSAFFDSGLTGKPFAKLLVRPVQDKAFMLKGEQYDRQKMFDYNIGEHILPGSLLNAISELVMQREVQEITLTRFHWNVSEEKGL